MNIKLLFFSICLTFILTSVSSFFSNTFAGIMVFDNVTTKGKPVKLRAFTKGRFFPEGGKLVEFYLNGKHIGTTLSGGDGIAFLKYTPLSPGIKHLKVKKGIDKDKGMLLVIKKGERIILIEIESTLFEFPFIPNPVRESKETLIVLTEKFKLIYVTSLIGAKKSRDWLKKNEYPTSAVLKWNANLLDVLKEQGIKPYTIIGSSAVLSEASEIEKKFSFEETKNGMRVKNWKELGLRLKEEAEKNGEP